MKRSEVVKMVFGVAVSMILLLAFSPLVVCADIPSKINYQGYLTDSIGTPINGPVQMTFSIYDAETGGTALWTEAQDVSVTQGIYNVSLGAINPIALTFDIPYYLGIRVGTIDPEMTPRKALTTVPYAFRAKTAEIDHDTLGGLSCSGGQVAKWNGSQWVCGADNDTTYTAATGLTLTGTEFSADESYLQRRVSTPCASGFAIRGINADGTVVCEPMPTVPGPSPTVATLTGTASAGTSDAYSRGDHEHGIGAGAITGTHILDGTITNADISPAAAIDFSKLSGAASSTHDHDATYVNEGQASSISTPMIQDGAVTDAKITGPISASKVSSSGLNADTLDGIDSSGFVKVAGDTMTGTLNLPANGLVAGTTQLVLSGGNVGIGTAAPNEQLEIAGNLRIPVTTGSAGMIKSGASRFIHNYGTDNFFAGVDAGNVAMTGVANTGVGRSAIISNTTGSGNTATGVNALYSNTTGNHNIAAGVNALISNTTGSGNTATGVNALNSNTTGGHNVATGIGALHSNTEG